MTTKTMFLNRKKYLVMTKKYYVLIQSPFNPDAVILLEKKWCHEGKNIDFFAIKIILERNYREISYDNSGIEKIRLVNGEELYNKFNKK